MTKAEFVRRFREDQAERQAAKRKAMQDFKDYIAHSITRARRKKMKKG